MVGAAGPGDASKSHPSHFTGGKPESLLLGRPAKGLQPARPGPGWVSSLRGGGLAVNHHALRKHTIWGSLFSAELQVSCRQQQPPGHICNATSFSPKGGGGFFTKKNHEESKSASWRPQCHSQGVTKPSERDRRGKASFWLLPRPSAHTCAG